jgi:Tfp pilus assembly protein PilF
LAPDAPATRFAYGLELLQGDQTAAAVPELKAAIRLAPKMKQAYFALGRAYQKLGQKMAAKTAFERVSALTREELARDQGSPSVPPRTPLPKK